MSKENFRGKSRGGSSRRNRPRRNTPTRRRRGKMQAAGAHPAEHASGKPAEQSLKSITHPMDDLSSDESLRRLLEGRAGTDLRGVFTAFRIYLLRLVSRMEMTPKQRQRYGQTEDLVGAGEL